MLKLWDTIWLPMEVMLTYNTQEISGKVKKIPSMDFGNGLSKELALKSPGISTEIQISGYHPNPTKSNFLEIRSVDSHFK